jgi:hypothetical protein
MARKAATLSWPLPSKDGSPPVSTITISRAVSTVMDCPLDADGEKTALRALGPHHR